MKVTWKSSVAALAACASLATGASLPATAAAAPAQIEAATFSDGGPRHEVATTLTVTGTTDAPRFVTAYEPAAGLGCDAPRAQTTALIAGAAAPAGAFSVTGAHTYRSIGRRPLCVTVHDDANWGRWNDPGVVARFEQTTAVANARASISIASQLAGNAFTITVSGETEARRFLEAEVRYRATNCSAAHGSGSNLDPSLMPVGPGPFAKTFSLRFVSDAPSDQVVCAQLAAPTGAFGEDRLLRPDATAEHLLRWPGLPAPPEQEPGPADPEAADVAVLGTPADAASGVVLNPTFTWQASARPQVRKPEADTLQLRRVRGERVTPLLRLDARGFRLLDASAGLEVYDYGSTATIARHEVADGTVSVRLERGLPPGVYEWTVVRAGRAAAPRRFTVVAPRMVELHVAASRKAHASTGDPGWTFLSLRSAPYVRYEFAYRLGGSWTRYRIAARRSAQQSAVIGWSCRRPGGTFHWRLTAIDGWGATRTASGSSPNVTRAACDRMRRSEAEERRARQQRRAAEERRRRAREERRRRAEERRRVAEQERFKRNCEAVGGAPVWIDEGGGWRRLICRAPFGGELPVPGFHY